MSALHSKKMAPSIGCLSQSSFVKPKQSVSADSVFSDPVWKMDSMVTTPGVKRSRKNWDYSRVPGFPGGFSLALAEYAYARLYTPVPSYGREVIWPTVHNELTTLATFAEFCAARSLQGFHQVTAEDCSLFLRELQFSEDATAKSDERIQYVVRMIYRLWDYRSCIGLGLPELPFGKPCSRLFKKNSRKNGENATPVIPEPVFGVITAVALDYVLKYAPTIVKVWHELTEFWVGSLLPEQLAKRRALDRLRRYAETALSGTPAPWRELGWATIGDLYAELFQLRNACALVVFAFSGVRASELLAIEAGCCVTDDGADGSPRAYLNTKVHKHRQGGSDDTWVVIPEVVQAIKVLEELSARVALATGDRRLFLTDGTSHFFGVHRAFHRERISEFTTEALVVQLESFRKHCGEKLGRPVPDWAGNDGVAAPWKFNTRQFRRTLARYIARQPFGIIAGMRQYKHIEAAVFEGYAGQEPEWNKLLADERVLASIDILEEVAMDLSNGELAGEVGQKLKEQFALEFKGRAEDFPPSQIAKWLANTTKPMFVGKFNFCFFDPIKAVCTSGQAGAPVLNHCQPDVCGNACIGKRHISKWEAQLQQAEELASYPKTSRVHQEAMSTEIAKLRAVVENYGSRT